MIRSLPRISAAGLALFALGCSSKAPSPGSSTPSPWWEPPGSSASAKLPVVPASVPLPSTPSAAQDSNGCVHRGDGRDFPVGPGQKYASLGAVPFEALKAGDTVRVFWREQPYREKLMIGGIGREKNPIRVCGVPGPAGQLPVIDGQDATTRPELDFPFDGHQVRGLVIIGHPHDQPWENTPSHIVFEGFEVRNGAPPFSFTNRAGKKTPYSNIAAGIFVERANHVTIRGCRVTANNNGLFIGAGGDDVTLTRDVLIEGNHIYGNGSIADYYEHNVYNEASNVVYQYNRFGAPRIGKTGMQGANIKERSAGVVIRYNWIEDGAHILDIVDAQEAKAVTKAMPSFHATHVYGNVIIRGTTPSGSLVHYGGDSGIYADYRKGTLFFYHNTVIIRNDSYRDYTRTAIFELSTNDEHLDSRNNIYFSTTEPNSLRVIGMFGARDQITSGISTFAGDWVGNGFTPFDLTPGLNVQIRAKVQNLEKMKRGAAPGFRDAKGEDYSIGSSDLGAPVALRPEVPVNLLPTSQYVRHQRSKPRSDAKPGALGD